MGKGDLLSHDEYGPRESLNLQGDRIAFDHGVTSCPELVRADRGQIAGLEPPPGRGVARGDGQAVWGVEWRSAETANGLVVNLCNYQKTSDRDVDSGQPGQYPPATC